MQAGSRSANENNTWRQKAPAQNAQGKFIMLCEWVATDMCIRVCMATWTSYPINPKLIKHLPQCVHIAEHLPLHMCSPPCVYASVRVRTHAHLLWQFQVHEARSEPKQKLVLRAKSRCRHPGGEVGVRQWPTSFGHMRTEE